MSFSDNVVVEGIIYQMSQVLSFSSRERAYNATSFNKNDRANFSGDKKSTMMLSGVSIFDNTRKKLLVKSPPHGCLASSSNLKVFNFPI